MYIVIIKWPDASFNEKKLGYNLDQVWVKRTTRSGNIYGYKRRRRRKNNVIQTLIDEAATFKFEKYVELLLDTDEEDKNSEYNDGPYE